MNTENIKFIKSLDKDDIAKIQEESPFSATLYKELKDDSDSFEDESIFEDEFVSQSLNSLVETIKLIGVNPKSKKVEQVKPQAKSKPSKSEQSKPSTTKEASSPKKKKTSQELKEREKEAAVEALQKELDASKKRVEANSKFKDRIAEEVEKYVNTLSYGPKLKGLGSKDITADDFDSKLSFLNYKIKLLKGKISFYKGVEKQDGKDFQKIAERVGFSYKSIKPRRKTIGAKKEKSLLEKAQNGFKKWWNS